MGLDQGFYQRKASYASQRENEDNPVAGDGTVVPWEQLGGVHGVTVTEQVGYLRKANAVHGWIVNNLADGVDECQKIYLDPDAVDRLLADIETALADPKGNTVLPPVEGFFFGAYERDDWYVDDLLRTKKILEWIKSAMERHGDGSLRDSYDWYYQASW